MDSVEPNSIIQGDCLEWLDKVKPNSVDLCYIDPPFFTKRNFKDFTDTWWGGRDTYLSWMRRRIQKIHRVLKDTGSIFLHCDHHANYKLRIILDDIFGEKNFVNEIIWQVGSVSGYKCLALKWVRNHDMILCYKKGSDFKFNKQYMEITNKKTIERYNKVDSFGNSFKYFINKKTGHKRKQYLKDSKGVAYGDVWVDILGSQILNNTNEENFTGYSTQKPESLLKRIIECSTNKGDLVLDCFGGSGTTAAVAKKLGRDYIIGDVNPESIKIMKTRLEVDNS